MLSFALNISKNRGLSGTGSAVNDHSRGMNVHALLNGWIILEALEEKILIGLSGYTADSHALLQNDRIGLSVLFCHPSPINLVARLPESATDRWQSILTVESREAISSILARASFPMELSLIGETYPTTRRLGDSARHIPLRRYCADGRNYEFRSTFRC
jgi:hypothetical protein